MYEQLSFLNEIKITDQEHHETMHKDYVSPCCICKCRTCVNNVDCDHSTPSEEMKEPCFNCDECFYFAGTGERRKKWECNDYVITNYAAEQARKKFRII